MKALLMAAGMGTRISHDIKGIPKCAVDIGGITLIENTINVLTRCNIKDIGVVVGYKGQYIVDLLGNKNIKFFANPFFDITNSIASLWFARDFLRSDDSYIFMNADVFFETRLLELILNEPMDPVLWADESRIQEADYRFYYKDEKLQNHGKHLSNEETTGEYVGIAKVGYPFIRCFTERLEELIQNQHHQLWWENILYSFIGEADVFVKSVGNNFWAEVDLIGDYHRILVHKQGKGVLGSNPRRSPRCGDEKGGEIYGH
ncbi:MAG: phosphocholine cytidylyltransferase family protein [Desulfitobacteriaceae bacterium]